jgi:Spy/CpxP family protein refolding chaperone
MRKSHVLALVVASLVSTASFAGAQAPAAGAKTDRHAVMGRRAEGGRGMRGGALRGVKLSDAEKAKVKQIHTKYAAEGKALRTSMKPVMQEARALRQKGDTAGLRALWEKNKANRDQVQALQVRQQAEIRTALSSENQKLFDANVQRQATRRAEWDKKGKGGKHGGRGQRGQRAGKIG